jgi:hypothetical protein
MADEGIPCMVYQCKMFPKHIAYTLLRYVQPSISTSPTNYFPHAFSSLNISLVEIGWGVLVLVFVIVDEFRFGS